MLDHHRCPLTAIDETLVARYLRTLSLQELVFETEQVVISLSPAEKIMYDLNLYCTSYDDVEGRIRFITTLIHDHIIYPLQIPNSYRKYPSLEKLLQPPVYDYYIPIARELKKELDACLTDAIEIIPQENLAISNPRWEHEDTEKQERNPTSAAFGDRIILMADIQNYPEGAPVTFDIYDMSVQPPLRIVTVKGEHGQGTGKGAWEVADRSRNRGKMKLAFEAIVRSKATEKQPITLSPDGVVREVYFEDEEGKTVEKIKRDQKVVLVVKTENMVGTTVDIDMSDAQFDFEYNGTILQNDILDGLEITSDEMKISLKVRKGT